jgi:hypothetical protein
MRRYTDRTNRSALVPAFQSDIINSERWTVPETPSAIEHGDIHPETALERVNRTTLDRFEPNQRAMAVALIAGACRRRWLALQSASGDPSSPPSCLAHDPSISSRTRECSQLARDFNMVAYGFAHPAPNDATREFLACTISVTRDLLLGSATKPRPRSITSSTAPTRFSG